MECLDQLLHRWNLQKFERETTAIRSPSRSHMSLPSRCCTRFGTCLYLELGYCIARKCPHEHIASHSAAIINVLGVEMGIEKGYKVFLHDHRAGREGVLHYLQHLLHCVLPVRVQHSLASATDAPPPYFIAKSFSQTFSLSLNIVYRVSSAMSPVEISRLSEAKLYLYLPDPECDWPAPLVAAQNCLSQASLELPSLFPLTSLTLVLWREMCQRN